MHDEATSSVERHLTVFFTVKPFLTLIPPRPSSILHLQFFSKLILSRITEESTDFYSRSNTEPVFSRPRGSAAANYHSLVLVPPATFYPQGYGQGRAGKESALGRPGTTFHPQNSPRLAQYKRQAPLDLVAQTICPKLDNCCLSCQPCGRNTMHGMIYQGSMHPFQGLLLGSDMTPCWPLNIFMRGHGVILDHARAKVVSHVIGGTPSGGIVSLLSSYLEAGIEPESEVSAHLTLTSPLVTYWKSSKQLDLQSPSEPSTSCS